MDLGFNAILIDLRWSAHQTCTLSMFYLLNMFCCYINIRKKPMSYFIPVIKSCMFKIVSEKRVKWNRALYNWNWYVTGHIASATYYVCTEHMVLSYFKIKSTFTYLLFCDKKPYYFTYFLEHKHKCILFNRRHMGMSCFALIMRWYKLWKWSIQQHNNNVDFKIFLTWNMYFSQAMCNHRIMYTIEKPFTLAWAHFIT